MKSVQQVHPSSDLACFYEAVWPHSQHSESHIQPPSEGIPFLHGHQASAAQGKLHTCLGTALGNSHTQASGCEWHHHTSICIRCSVHNWRVIYHRMHFYDPGVCFVQWCQNNSCTWFQQIHSPLAPLYHSLADSDGRQASPALLSIHNLSPSQNSRFWIHRVAVEGLCWESHWSRRCYSKGKACCYPWPSQCTAYRSSFHSRSLGKALEGYGGKWDTRFEATVEAFQQIHTQIQHYELRLPFLIAGHMSENIRGGPGRT